MNDFGAGSGARGSTRGRAMRRSSSPSRRLPHPGGAGLNDITFDHAGNIYLSDSAQGVVWKAPPGGGVATAWIDDPLLTTTGVPPFGANGLRFNHDESALFVANTGSDTVLRIPIAGGSPVGPAAPFAQAINGADGLLVDEHDNLWVAANQGDEVVVLDPGWEGHRPPRRLRWGGPPRRPGGAAVPGEHPLRGPPPPGDQPRARPPYLQPGVLDARIPRGARRCRATQSPQIRIDGGHGDDDHHGSDDD